MTEAYEKALQRIEEVKINKADKLNLSALGLTEIPVEVAKLTWLTSFECSNNQITDLAAIQHLIHLTSINCSDNYITDLTPIQHLTHLTVIYCSYNQITDLTPIQHLIHLTEIDCERNQITDLTPIQHLTKLISINCSRNQITDLTHIQYLTKLTEINCSGNQITDLTPIQHLTKLTSIDCRNNQITGLTPIQHLTKLTSIDCFNNQITDLTPTQYLIHLTSINCQDNQISDLTPIQHLTNLTSIDCSDNLITDLTPIQYLTHLTSMDCSDNQITDLTPIQHLTNLTEIRCSNNQIIDLTPIKHLIHLTSIDCSVTQITDLTPIQHSINLTSIDCWNTQITDLTPIQYLTNLTTIDCSNNQITDLTPVKYLTNLTSIECANTQITDLTPIQHLTNLTSIDCSINQITDLTPIQHLTKLTLIYCFNNQITDLTPIQYLTNLTEINCERNQITDLTPIQHLTKLTLIGCSDNQIKVLPEWVLRFTDEIDVDNNPFIEPPAEIVRQGRAAITTYYNNPRQRLGELKIIMVGEGEAGKTSVIKTLLGEAFNPQEDQTHGIRIRKEDLSDWGVPTIGRFWDFGGQEIMHATHKFFLSERSVYVLVLNSRKDENPDYWLRHIETYGGGASATALVVFNKMEGNSAYDLDRRVLKQKYPFIGGFYPVSAKTGAGIAELRKALFQCVADHPLAESKFPTDWIEVKNALEKEREDYINYDHFRAVCAKNGVKDEQYQEFLIRALNDLGVALHFENLRGFNTQILNPLWLTNAVYRLINAPQLGTDRGVLCVNKMGDMLHDPRYSGEDYHFPKEKWMFIVRIMESFELCYETIREQEYIVPERLPAAGEDNLPLQPVAGDKSIGLVVKFPEFMPTSIFPRLMVRTHHLIMGEMRWRTAMQLEEKDSFQARARIMYDRDDRTIRIEATGRDPRGLLSVLRKEIEAIRSSFVELKKEELVSIQDGIFVKYETLLAHEKRNRKDYFCPELERDYVVADLLDGIESKEMRSAATQTPLSVFISYAHADEKEYEALKLFKNRVFSQVRLNNITLWDDGAILPGEKWSNAIWQHFEQADIVVCLISPNYISSDFCYSKELKAALEAMEKGEKSIFPVRLIVCNIKDLPIGQIQGAPSEWINPGTIGKPNHEGWAEMEDSFVRLIKARKTWKMEQMDGRDKGRDDF